MTDDKIEYIPGTDIKIEKMQKPKKTKQGLLSKYGITAEQYYFGKKSEQVKNINTDKFISVFIDKNVETVENGIIHYKNGEKKNINSLR